jgi:hypothetical protein
MLKQLPPPSTDITSTIHVEYFLLGITPASELSESRLSSAPGTTNRKLLPYFKESAYRKLAKDPTDSTERKTIKLLKKSTLTEDIVKRLTPSGSRPTRLYGLRKYIKKESL